MVVSITAQMLEQAPDEVIVPILVGYLLSGVRDFRVRFAGTVDGLLPALAQAAEVTEVAGELSVSCDTYTACWTNIPPVSMN